MVDWERELTRPLQLKDGTVLLTLGDALAAIDGGGLTTLGAAVTADARHKLAEAARAGSTSSAERATQRVSVALSMQRLL